MVHTAPIFSRALFVILTVGCSALARESRSTANIAENLFITFSNACRSLMKTYSSDGSLLGEASRLLIVWHDTNSSLMSFPIEQAIGVFNRSGKFNSRDDTVITIHGFNDHAESAIPSAIARAYSRKGKYNVMLLDCSHLTTGQYVRAAYMSQLIGEIFARFLQQMTVTLGINADKIHLIGISLGAQTAGWTGKYFRNYTGQKIKRITGLDPAGPCFTYADISEVLNKNDADYVDVIHVNRGIQGILEAVGHSDYFVNGGGPNQPGCMGPNCSHQRAGLLYIESLYNNSELMGRKCESWDNFLESGCENNDISMMGFNSSSKSRGKFYLRTADDHPYGLGMKGTKVNTKSFLERLFSLGKK